MAKKDKDKKKDKKTKISKPKIQIPKKKIINTTIKPAKKPVVKKITSKDKINKAITDIDNILKTHNEPTLILISNGIGTDNRIKMEMKWNNAFIKNVNKYGISGATEEETVMLFLVGCQLKPEEFPGHDEVVSDVHPLLSADNHMLKR